MEGGRIREREGINGGREGINGGREGINGGREDRREKERKNEIENSRGE